MSKQEFDCPGLHEEKLNKKDSKTFECKGCQKCTGKLFKVPKCSQHQLCEKCMKNGPTYNNCEYCSSYFMSITKNITPKPNYCWLCQEYTQNVPKICEFHTYCNSCYKILLNNEIDPYVKISKCSDCKSFFIDAKQSTSLSFIFKTTQNSNKSNEINQNIRINSGTNTDVASKMCNHKLCGAENENLFKTPTCREHEYCINCIKNEKTQNECPTCLKYFEFLYKKMLHQVNFCCLCNDPAIKSNDKCEKHSYCKICSEFLENNDFSHIDLVSKCNNCTTKLKNSKFNEVKGLIAQEGKIELNSSSEIDKEINSDFIIKKIKLFTTPRCEQHEYCIECINSDINIEKIKIHCIECKNYFLCLRKTFKRSNSLCSLCNYSGIVPNDECKLHSYCKICTKFLQDNNPIYFNTVTECHICNAYFKKDINSEEEKKKLSNEKFNEVSKKNPQKDIKNAGSNTNLNKNSEERFPKQIEEKKNQGPIIKNLDTQKQNELNNPKKQEHPNLTTSKSSTCSELNQTFICSGCNSKKSKVFKTPRCTAHNLCEVCITKQSSTLKCDYCSMYFESLIRKKDQNAFKCSLCKLTPNSPNIKCKSHSYCKNCYEFLINNDFSHIITVANCEVCCNSFKIIKEKEESVEKIYNSQEVKQLSPKSKYTNPQIIYKTAQLRPDSQILYYPEEAKIPQYPIINPLLQFPPASSYNPNNSVTIDSNLLIKCSLCQGRDNVKGFLCNHNICAECLVKGCCSQIKNFMIGFPQCNRERVYKFSYFYCTYNGCGRPISVPTKMLKIYLIKFLNDPDRKAEFTQFSDLIFTFYLDVWITYYDGLI